LASTISVAHPDTDIPIILTASNFALDQPKSNGIKNFISSVEFICQSGIPGIFTVFEDETGDVKVYLGSRIVEANPFNDKFTSFGGSDFGYLKDGILVQNQCSINPSYTKLGAYREPLEMDNIEFKNNILAIRPYPGLDYSFFRFNAMNKPSAIIHSLYHSSTACIREGNVSLPEFIRYCSDEGIDFYLASFKNMNISSSIIPILCNPLSLLISLLRYVISLLAALIPLTKVSID
jgi:L-asparaginase